MCWFNSPAAVLWLLMGFRERHKLQKGMALCFQSSPQLQGKGDQTEGTISTAAVLMCQPSMCEWMRKALMPLSHHCKCRCCFFSLHCIKSYSGKGSLKPQASANTSLWRHPVLRTTSDVTAWERCHLCAPPIPTIKHFSERARWTWEAIKLLARFLSLDLKHHTDLLLLLAVCPDNGDIQTSTSLSGSVNKQQEKAKNKGREGQWREPPGLHDLR